MIDKSKFIQWMAAKGLSTATKNKYSYHFDRFPAESFTQHSVNDYLSQPENTNPNCRAFISNLRKFLIQEFPDDSVYYKITLPQRSGRRKTKLPDFPTEEELFKIEEKMDDERSKLMLLISFYGGLRPAGLLNIRAINFDWKKWKENPLRPAQLKVVEKGEKERIVFIPNFVIQRLSNWIKSSRANYNPSSKLWGIGYRRWHQFLTIASIKALGRSLSPHKLRHGCGTWMLSNGWSLQEISEYLGHASISTTQIYVHLDKKKMEDKYAEMF